MGRQMNVDLEGDTEYNEFTTFLEDSGRSYATKKSYRTSYRKLRNLLGKNVISVCISRNLSSKYTQYEILSGHRYRK